MNNHEKLAVLLSAAWVVVVSVLYATGKIQSLNVAWALSAGGTLLISGVILGYRWYRRSR